VSPGRSFAAVLRSLVDDLPGSRTAQRSRHEPLGHLAYADELAVKAEGLERFWQAHGLSGAPEAVVASPRPRGYRTSSKRRIVLLKGRVHTYFGEVAEGAAVVASPLEPEEHGVVYKGLLKKLNEPAFRPLASHLNYVIIRGTYDQRAVVFNVDELSTPLVRRVRALIEQVGELPVASFFLYVDPTRSDYYFESRRPDQAVTFKRISGPEQIEVAFAGNRYRFHPTSFSQVNESMVPEMLARAGELLAPARSEELLDLYCGYGLFSHHLAPSVRAVVGVDAEGPAITAARANTQLNPCATPRRFVAARIDRDFMARDLRRAGSPEIVLLDPPRNGPMPGVVAALGRRQPSRVLHIFCDVDQIPTALEQWRAAGYAVQRVVPLDMFAGAANLEVLVLLTPDRAPARRR